MRLYEYFVVQTEESIREPGEREELAVEAARLFATIAAPSTWTVALDNGKSVVVIERSREAPTEEKDGAAYRLLREDQLGEREGLLEAIERGM